MTKLEVGKTNQVECLIHGKSESKNGSCPWCFHNQKYWCGS